jgi:predicted ATPase
MIKAIHIRNFKCFEEESIALGPMTLATGLNGTGKSSLIQSLLLLRQSYLQGLLRNGLLAINGELVELGTGRDALNESAEEDVIAFGLSWTDGLSARWAFAYDKTADVLSKQSAEAPETAFERPPLSGDFHYLSAERIGPRASFSMSDYSVGHLRQLGPRGEYASYFLSLFGRDRVAIPGLVHSEAASESLIDQVEAWLGEVSPGARLHVTAHRAVDAVELRFSFAGPHGNTNEYRATNVGFGLTYTLSILAAVLSARPGAMLVIENPEAHLHPRGQVRVAGLLARAAAAGVQVVVETHSDHVLNGLRLAVHDGVLAPAAACIHYFERRVTPERIYHTYASPQIDEEGRLDQWPDGFFDEWERSLSRLLESRRGAA